jgi:hypothetical protein
MRAASPPRGCRVLEPNADITKVKLELQEVDVPAVEPGFVLVKMVCPPAPSDPRTGATPPATTSRVYKRILGTQGGCCGGTACTTVRLCVRQQQAGDSAG